MKNSSINLIDTKEKENLNEQVILNYLSNLDNPFMNLTVSDVSKDLKIGINQAYELFDRSDFPTIRVGKRKQVTLLAYLLWKIKQ